MGTRLKSVVVLPPTEGQEQRSIAAWLDARGLVWCHIPNEGRRSKARGARLKAQGLKKGVPDNQVYTVPPRYPDARGVAFEMKKPGKKPTPDQKRWLKDLADCGWLVNVCYNAREAVEWLESLGY